MYDTSGYGLNEEFLRQPSPSTPGQNEALTWINERLRAVSLRLTIKNETFDLTCQFMLFARRCIDLALTE